MNHHKDSFHAISKLFDESTKRGIPLKVCAPMVRYSSLPFRHLVKLYKCDLTFTHMMLADCFSKAQSARDADFQYSETDRPLIAQFAASDPEYFASAAQLISPYVDGVDLNCGCPQRWAIKEGIGACMCSNADLISRIVSRCRQVNPDLPVSVKIRILETIEETVSLAQAIEKAGAAFISVHGRTIKERNVIPHFEYVNAIKDNVKIPVIHNGGVYSPEEIEPALQKTGADGLMCAQGLLNNPALFAGYSETPIKCVQDWVNIALSYGTTFVTFKHHLVFMLENVLPKNEKKIFNNLSTIPAVMDYLDNNFGIKYQSTLPT